MNSPRHVFVLIVTGLLVIATMATAAVISTSEVDIQGEFAHEGHLALLSLQGSDDEIATWTGTGSEASLHIEGEDVAEFGGLVRGESTPVDETIQLTDWKLSGGEWRAGTHVLVGTSPAGQANISFSESAATLSRVDAQPTHSQVQRFSHDVEPITFDPSDSIAWSNTKWTTLRVTGTFIVTAWSADMVISDQDTAATTYHSGSIREPVEGAEAASDVVYENKLRINNLYVEDGWIEVTIQNVDDVQLFTGEGRIDAQGSVQSDDAILTLEGETRTSGPLETTGPSSFIVAPADEAGKLSIEPQQSTDGWTINGETIPEPVLPLPDDGETGMDGYVADPLEGAMSVWLRTVIAGLSLLLVLLVVEWSGGGAMIRSRWRLKLYHYDRVKPRAYWRILPKRIWTRLMFDSALAAAGREDHQTAIELATTIPEDSQWWKPARFISIQSTAALGNETIAELELANLAAKDPRYEKLAAENPFLRNFVG